MTRALVCALLAVAGCSAAPASKACSDESFLALAAQCGAAVARCKAAGGSPEECGIVCDEWADDWARSCGQ